MLKALVQGLKNDGAKYFLTRAIFANFLIFPIIWYMWCNFPKIDSAFKLIARPLTPLLQLDSFWNKVLLRYNFGHWSIIWLNHGCWSEVRQKMDSTSLELYANSGWRFIMLHLHSTDYSQSHQGNRRIRNQKRIFEDIQGLNQIIGKDIFMI